MKAILLCCWRCTHHDCKGTCCGSSGQRSRFTIALTRRLAVACGFTAGQFRRHCRVAPRKWWSSRPAESSTDTRRFASTASAAQSTAHRPRSKAGTRRGRHPLPTSSDYFRRRRPSHPYVATSGSSCHADHADVPARRQAPDGEWLWTDTTPGCPCRRRCRPRISGGTLHRAGRASGGQAPELGLGRRPAVARRAWVRRLTASGRAAPVPTSRWCTRIARRHTGT